MTSPSRPWMMFYPTDWRADPKLRMCSLAARGLWMEMLAIMHESERYGSLLLNGKQPSDRQLANLVGASVEEVVGLTAELETEGVFSRDHQGVIYSRRMKNDEKRHKKASTSGKEGARRRYGKGGENPATPKGSPKPTPKGDPSPQSPESIDHIGSVDKSTAAGAAQETAAEDEEFDPVKALFDDGVRVLGASGVKETRARSLIGQWRKQYGDDPVAIAIAAADSRGISQPVEWIPKRLATRGPGTNGSGRPTSHAEVVLREIEMARPADRVTTT